jgi:hypothetical protein
MQPVQITVLGQAVSTPIIPDVKQDPFNIGIGVSLTTGTVTSWAIEHCFDFSTVMSPTWNGSTGVTWFPNTGLNNTIATTTTLPANGNYAFPVAAIRVNISNANATAIMVVNIIQASISP